ncbi:transmembrane protease serine 9-like [Neocloeon triangulifer]|uniref:transmembrane protease serine 9-like n=1 Tax=Neocloeon triangulifer TaxID=2078957 RepID=UPI00286F79D0|nr:transmembrane protease serine 9-like [Neocloeon triangulifer]
MLKFTISLVLITILFGVKGDDAISDLQSLFKEWPVVKVSKKEVEKYIREKNNRPKLDSVPKGNVAQPSSAGVSNVKIKDQIIGGQNAAQKQFPWQAQVSIDNSYLCGGSLISTNFVVTAGHCVSGFSTWVVYIGGISRSSNTETGEQRATAAKGFTHPNFNSGTLANDIAFLQFSSPFTLDDFVNVIRLPKTSDATNSFVGTTVTVSGYGKTSNTAGPSNALMFVSLLTISNAQCMQKYGSRYVLSTTICTAAYPDKSTCNGDSGGPMVYKEADGKFTLLGIVSYGSSSSCNQNPTGFTRVPSYVGYISNVTNIQTDNMLKFTVSLVLIIISFWVKGDDAIGNLQSLFKEWPVVKVSKQEVQNYIKNKNNRPKLDSIPIGNIAQPSSAGVSNVKIKDQIIGGQNAAQKQFPWQAQVSIDSSYLCGGSLISATYVVTAGHCVSGFSTWVVNVGGISRSSNTETGEQMATAAKGFTHPNFNSGTLANDIAFLQFSSPFTLDDFVNVIRLPKTSDATNTFVGTNITVSGYGKTSNTAAPSNVLKFVSLLTISNAQCMKKYGSRYVLSTTICTAAYPDKSTCSGDSGGPMVYKEADGKFTLLGVVSYGSSSSCNQNPSGFTRVPSYVGYISNVTNIQIRP